MNAIHWLHLKSLGNVKQCSYHLIYSCYWNNWPSIWKTFRNRIGITLHNRDGKGTRIPNRIWEQGFPSDTMNQNDMFFGTTGSSFVKEEWKGIFVGHVYMSVMFNSLFICPRSFKHAQVNIQVQNILWNSSLYTTIKINPIFRFITSITNESENSF